MPDQLSAADAAFASELDAFIADELAQRDGESPQARRARIVAASKAIGLFQMTQPAEYGGQPGSLLQLTLAREAIAAARVADASAAFGPAPGVLAGVDGPLRETHLEPLLAGAKRSAFAFTEPDDAPRHSWAVADGDDYVINGAKSYVTGGADADFMAALIHIDDAGPAMVIIDADALGVSASNRFASLDGSHHVAFTFDNVRVPKHHVVGRPGEGMPRALRQIGDTRLVIAAQCTGLMLHVLTDLEPHLAKPHRGGRPLAELESVRLRYADARIQTYAARSMLYRTARLGDAGENIVNESIATKVFASEAAAKVVDCAIQLVGGQALREGHPLAALYREVRVYQLTEGASDVLRLNLARGRLDLGKGRL
ncbi:MAG: acyl-CoA dehydrogenase [Pseudomonadota bacterium]